MKFRGVVTDFAREAVTTGSLNGTESSGLRLVQIERLTNLQIPETPRQ